MPRVDGIHQCAYNCETTKGNSVKISLPYTEGSLEAEVSRGTCIATLDIRDAPELPNRVASIQKVLENPIGLDKNIFDTVQSGETVSIIVSDSFRQTRADQVLPILIGGLVWGGVDEESISITFATGTHRGPTPTEQKHILGEGLYRRFQGRLFAHDAWDRDNLVYLGTTSRGTRVEINRRVHESDRIVVTGSVVLHYFGGYGGGRKSVVPGIASVDTIAHNHAMNLHPHEDRLDPAVCIGGMEGNPVAEDMLEATKLTHVDCIVNTVLNKQGQISGFFTGELEAAHTAATNFAHTFFSVNIPERADLVIAASPTTKNFVQTHKALFNAYQAVKPGGRIVLLAPCPEGLGGEQFLKWIRLATPSAIIAGLREQSEINGQTALSTVQKAPITILVTGLSEPDVALLGARKAGTLQGALDLALAELKDAGNPEPNYYLMPSAAYTVPFLET